MVSIDRSPQWLLMGLQFVYGLLMHLKKACFEKGNKNMHEALASSGKGKLLR